MSLNEKRIKPGAAKPITGIKRQPARNQIGKQADQRGNHIVYERIDDRLKRSTNDNADCQIHDISSQRKFLKFLQQFFHSGILSFVMLYFGT